MYDMFLILKAFWTSELPLSLPVGFYTRVLFQLEIVYMMEARHLLRPMVYCDTVMRQCHVEDRSFIVKGGP